MNECGDKEDKTKAKAQLVPGPIATAGPVCAGEEGDYIWEYSDLKPNLKKRLTVSAFLFFSDLVLNQNIQRTNH